MKQDKQFTQKILDLIESDDTGRLFVKPLDLLTVDTINSLIFELETELRVRGMMSKEGNI